MIKNRPELFFRTVFVFLWVFLLKITKKSLLF